MRRDCKNIVFLSEIVVDDPGLTQFQKADAPKLVDMETYSGRNLVESSNHLSQRRCFLFDSECLLALFQLSGLSLFLGLQSLECREHRTRSSETPSGWKFWLHQARFRSLLCLYMLFTPEAASLV
jgi:hypothetical protein